MRKLRATKSRRSKLILNTWFVITNYGDKVYLKRCNCGKFIIQHKTLSKQEQERIKNSDDFAIGFDNVCNGCREDCEELWTASQPSNIPIPYM